MPRGQVIKPKFEEYKDWMIDNLKINIDDITPIYYDSVANCIHRQFGECKVWNDFTGNFNNYSSIYRRYIDERQNTNYLRQNIFPSYYQNRIILL